MAFSAKSSKLGGFAKHVRVQNLTFAEYASPSRKFPFYPMPLLRS
jgi:hypothetical protein